MKEQAYLLVIAAFALPAGGVLLDRSMAASADRIAAPVDARLIRADFESTRPVDADYAVPGVLDDRSWKPEYDRMPAVHVASYARRRHVAAQPDEMIPVTIAGEAAQPIVAPILPAEKGSVAPADDGAAMAPQAALDRSD